MFDRTQYHVMLILIRIRNIKILIIEQTETQQPHFENKKVCVRPWAVCIALSAPTI